MKTKKITITISGAPKTGKTVMRAAIVKMLSALEYKVFTTGRPHCNDTLRYHICNDTIKKLEQFERDNLEIHIIEQLTSREMDDKRD